jgi:hypothetical protein
MRLSIEGDGQRWVLKNENRVISGYASERAPQDALNCLQRLQVDASEPEHIIYECEICSAYHCAPPLPYGVGNEPSK